MNVTIERKTLIESSYPDLRCHPSKTLKLKVWDTCNHAYKNLYLRSLGKWFMQDFHDSLQCQRNNAKYLIFYLKIMKLH